jgi:GR25 family glycosyltransferase involved in LPS biosynthesis
LAGIDEVEIECLDARPPEVDINLELEKVGLQVANRWIHMQPKRGDFGGFIGHYNSWRKCVELDEPLMVFEDDAIVPDGFIDNLNLILDTPPPIDLLSLCVNDYGKMFYDQKVLFDNYGYHAYHRPLRKGERNQFDEGHKYLCRIYQPWTLTATLYYPKAAQSLINTVVKMGVHMNADAFVHHRARLREFNGYAPKPEYLDLVVQFNEGHSIIQSS